MTSSGSRFAFGPGDGRSLDIQAELTLDIDGRAASITGAGDRLVMHLDSPGHTLHAVQGLTSSAAVGALASGLRAAGLRLDVEGVHGRLLSLGAGVDSVLGRLSTGSRAVAAGSPRALTYLGIQVLRRTFDRRGTAVGVTAGALGVAAVRWTVNRRRSGSDRTL